MNTINVEKAAVYSTALVTQGRVVVQREDFDDLYQFHGILQDLEIPCELYWNENGEYIIELT